MNLFNTTRNLAALSLIAFQVTAQGAENWHTSIEEAVKEAKSSNRSVMIKFTGSDWCPPCKEIQKKVFDKKEFTEGVKSKFVLCVIDSPNGDKKLAEKNRPTLQQYKIAGFPTTILLDQDGKEFSRYNPSQFDTVKKMLDQLNYQLRRKDMF